MVYFPASIKTNICLLNKSFTFTFCLSLKKEKKFHNFPNPPRALRRRLRNDTARGGGNKSTTPHPKSKVLLSSKPTTDQYYSILKDLFLSLATKTRKKLKILIKPEKRIQSLSVLSLLPESDDKRSVLIVDAFAFSHSQ